MWPLLWFLFFNAGLPTADVVTDLLNFLTLLPDHPGWALIILTWMFTSFALHVVFFSIKVIKAKRKRNTTYNTWSKLAKSFYKEVLIHFPGVATFHHLRVSKRLYHLNYGTKDFKMEDHKEVERLLAEAGRISHGESMYEAGPQSVTQVKLHNTNLKSNIGPHS